MTDRFIDSIIPFADMAFMLKTVLRLMAAALAGGIIGNNREHINRPAGIRTNILVCAGAALTVITSEFVCMKYAGTVNIDPTRLGAQVVSGIGFLGAGTILKEGFSVKGLTTAASLWAVSCVGLAFGSGFYGGGIAAAVMILITLRMARHIFMGKGETRCVAVKAASLDDAVTSIAAVFRKVGITVISSEILIGKESDEPELRYIVAVPKNSELFYYSVDRIKMSEGVVMVHVE